MVVFSSRPFSNILKYRDHRRDLPIIWKQDTFRHILRSSASMYQNTGSQFFRTITGIQSGTHGFDESRFVMIFLTILRVMEILCSFRLVLEGTTGKEIPESSRLELLEKFLANNFALSDAEDNTSGPLNIGGIADLPLLRTLLASPESQVSGK